ncbi:TrmH family RNA methyltransferase [Marinimicrobium alkaliphilum]|uniref:TrmH family RNA methyltransferase n=1 Tax=Marinimicrobium alkaliphilum TaxID=2202654 RepID=UPI000DB9BF4D|nr:RNA methyltransferase [Marinimicrobium alkaliphilum]
MSHHPEGDSQAYREKKRFYDSLLTVYGRKPVLEALSDPNTRCHRLHLADSNKSAGILEDIIRAAKAKGAEICYHGRAELSRISKNVRQDQGVAADLVLPGYQHFEEFLARPPARYTLLALDGISNPQNLGMIIRSACAGNIDGILVPRKGSAQIDPLVIKASAGTLFRAPILRCEQLAPALAQAREQGADACALSSHAKYTLKDYQPSEACIYVLGNETEGVSKDVLAQCNQRVRIPMNNGVESLNVAVTAALIAFR